MTKPPSTRRGGAKWKQFRDRFKADCQKRNLPCWRCNGEILYTGPANYSQSFEADHALPPGTTLRDHPELMWDRTILRPAHVACNRSNRAPEPPLPGEWIRPPWID